MEYNKNKREKFVADGVFRAEIDELFQRKLSEDGYSGVDVRITPLRTEIIIKVARSLTVSGEKGRRIRELTALLQKRFNISSTSIELYAQKVLNRGLSAVAQVESLRYKILRGSLIRRAANSVLRFVMKSGAKGCEIIVSGKLRAQRAKSMRFKDGYMISTGQPARDLIDHAMRHVMLRQGVLGIKVRIVTMGVTGETSLRKYMPDCVIIHKPIIVDSNLPDTTEKKYVD
jgi:small subunit ribosomal protein S3e